MTQHLSDRQCPIRYTSYPFFSLNNDLTLSQTTNCKLFQTESVCRRQFHFGENDRKLSKCVENTVGKGEIARYEQFLLFPQCFQKVYSADT